MTEIIEKPFDWNDNFSEIAQEDFSMIQKDLPYCTCQTIGMALAKLELLEKQGCKVEPQKSEEERRMTNREKFIEVFGDSPQRHHITKSWWDEEYVPLQEPKTEKVIKMRDVTPEEQEAIDRYIKSISKPTGINVFDFYKEQEPCEDAISRQAVIEEIENGIKAGNYEDGYEKYPHINDMDDIIECIKYADSIQPKPKTGHWKIIPFSNNYGEYRPNKYMCSECGWEIDLCRGLQQDTGHRLFCEHCGAKMVEP